MLSWEMSLSDFQEGMENVDFLKRIIQLRDEGKNNSNEKVYNFDFAMACLLGGTSTTSRFVKVYSEAISGTTLFSSNCGQALSGKLRNIPDDLIAFFNEASYKEISIKKLTEMLRENGEIDGVLRENSFKDRSGILRSIEKIIGIEVDRPVEDNMGKNDDVNLLNEQITRLIDSKVKQIVLTGAPGTGKTHTAREVARKTILSKEHEERYNKLSDEKKKRIDKILYSSQAADDHDKELQKFIEYAGRIGFVQFHPSYDYTDFVEGIRPTQKEGAKEIGFELRDGVFRKFCNRANEDNDPDNNKYIFIIDEINRADLSKVFGELMFGLEESYRGTEITTQYSSLREDMKKNGEEVNVKFVIPDNVFIIGTMNDIDRSVESIDFALRRRFVWINVKANEVMEHTIRKMLKEKTKNNSVFDIENVITDLVNSAKDLNKHIDENASEFNLNENYHIGPAYFGKIDLTKEYTKAKEDLWDTRVAPILYEYTRGHNVELVKKFIKDYKEVFMKAKPVKDNKNESAGEG